MVGPKLAALQALRTATADLHVSIAGEGGHVPLAAVELIVMVVAVAAAVVR